MPTQITLICWTHVGTIMLVHIHFVGPTSAIYIGQTHICLWDCATNMMAPRRANVWSNVGSTSYPHLQNKICIILYIKYTLIFILINISKMLHVSYCCMSHLLRRWPQWHNCVTPNAYRMQFLFVAVPGQ